MDTDVKVEVPSDESDGDQAQEEEEEEKTEEWDKNKCPLCDKTFGKKNTLTSHLITHFRKSPSKGGNQEEKTGDKANKTKTKKDKSKKKGQYKCTYCQKSFKTSDQLSEHWKRNGKGKSQICKICKKVFKRKCQWTTHMKKNKLDKPQNCEVCSESFAWRCLLKRHALIHGGQDQILPARFAKTRLGRDKVVDPDGYLYDKKRESYNKLYWICEKRKPKCLARVHTMGTNIVQKVGKHNHPVHPGKAEALFIIAAVKERALAGEESEHVIVSNALKDVPDLVRGCLPQAQGLRRLVKYHRKRHGHVINTPPAPKPLTTSERQLKKFVEDNISKRILADKDLNAEMQNFDAFPATYVTSMTGKPKLVDPDGHVYIINRKEGEDIHWCCEQHQYCKATAHTLNGNIIEINSDHSHSSDIGRSLVLQTVKRMKHRALITDHSLEQIITTEIETYVKHALSLLPDRNALQQTLECIRSKRDRAKVETRLEEAGIEPVPARFIPGYRGGRKLLDPDGYTYQLKSDRGTKHHWRCTRRGCNGRLHTLDDNIVKFVGKHTHPPAADNKADVFEVIRKMKTRAISSNEPLHDIISSEKAQVSPEVVARLPSQEGLFKSLKRAREVGVPQLFENQSAPPPGNHVRSQENQPPLIPYNRESEHIILSQDLLGENLDNNTIIYIVEQAALNATAELTVEQSSELQVNTDRIHSEEASENHVEGLGAIQAKYISNETTNPYLVDPSGHLYVYHRLRKQKSYWRCEVSAEMDCAAKAQTCGDKIILLTNDHNHAANPSRLTMLSTLSQMRSRASRTMEPLDRIMTSELEQMPDEARAYLPSKAHIMENLEAVRRRIEHTLSGPKKKKKFDEDYFQSIDTTNIALAVNPPVEEAVDYTDINTELMEMLPVPGKLVTSVKGKPKLVDPLGYIYHSRREEGPKHQWKCERHNCKARVHTLHKEIVKLVGCHSHTADATRSVVLDILAQIKEKAVETEAPEEEIVASEMQILDAEIQTLLPKKENIFRLIRRIRQQKESDAHGNDGLGEDHNTVVRDVAIPVKLVNSRVGHKKLADPEGYLYHHKKTVGAKGQWACEQRGTCKARAHTDGELIVKLVGYHSHAADVGRFEALNALDQMKRRAAGETDRTLEEIITSETSMITSDGAAWLPSQDRLLKILGKIRESGHGEEGSTDTIIDSAQPSDLSTNEIVIAVANVEGDGLV